MTEFAPFPKIARLNRGMVVTEKNDGTNACAVIVDATSDRDSPGRTPVAEVGDLWLYAQSRKRLIDPGKERDNFGFAGWVKDHAEELTELGPGRHYGEWWGLGIQRGYGLDEKRFSLFNSGRWDEENPPPSCCQVVPILATGNFSSELINETVRKLEETGSVAAPGYMKPEGVVVYLSAARNTLFKVTCEKDGVPKSVAERQAA